MKAGGGVPWWKLTVWVTGGRLSTVHVLLMVIPSTLTARLSAANHPGSAASEQDGSVNPSQVKHVVAITATVPNP
jgi:hypothetical protein